MVESCVSSVGVGCGKKQRWAAEDVLGQNKIGAVVCESAAGDDDGKSRGRSHGTSAVKVWDMDEGR